MSLLVLNIKRELEKGQKSFTDKTIRLLIATIEAHEQKASVKAALLQEVVANVEFSELGLDDLKNRIQKALS